MKKLFIVISILLGFLFIGFVNVKAEGLTQKVSPSSTTFPTFTPTWIAKFNNPIKWPEDLDEAYKFIDQGEDGWTFKYCENIPLPLFSWDMVKELQKLSIDDKGASRFIIDTKDFSAVLIKGGIAFNKSGRIDISEDELFKIALKSAFTGDLKFCGDKNEKPVVYGKGLIKILDQLPVK